MCQCFRAAHGWAADYRQDAFNQRFLKELTSTTPIGYTPVADRAKQLTPGTRTP